MNKMHRLCVSMNLLAACGLAAPSAVAQTTNQKWGEPLPASSLAGGAAALREWRRAENKATCRPVAFLDSGAENAKVRRAEYSGGWAIAFDMPKLRSAFGVAGAGVPAETVRELRAWPHFVRLAAGSAAGYGLEGRQPYPVADPDGVGLQSLAYMVIAGEGCTYNVWSRRGRKHLEYLLQQIRRVEPE